MRNLLISILVLLPFLVMGQTTTENFVKSTSYQETYTKAQIDAGGIPNDHKLESISYSDGLGRATQSISQRAGGNREDLITQTVYDVIGRQPKDYLPYPIMGNNADYLPNVLGLSVSYYYGKFPDDHNLVPEINPYTENVLEASPLARVLEQGAPGMDWKADHGNGIDHTIKYAYQTNASNEVQFYRVTFSGNTEVPSLVNPGYYVQHELYKNVTKNENWISTDLNKNTTQTFKNKKGQVVLKRTFNANDQLDTYYVYDDFGNLTYVIPPLVNTADGVSPAEMIDLCYQYRYDNRNRLIEKKIPGKGWEYIVYDILDRPVLTQDANMRANPTQNQWLFTKYDPLGRVAYTGLFSETGGSRAYYQNIIGGTTIPYENRITTPITVGGASIYYSLDNTHPTGSIEVLTVNYYDTYVDHTGITVPVSVLGTPTTKDTNVLATTQGLPTVSKVKVLGTDKWITSLSAYDHKRRAIYGYSYNAYLLSKDVVKSKLHDFTGRVVESQTNHFKTGHAAIITKDYFGYDHVGRLKIHQQQIDSEPVQLIAENHYDALGQLIKKDVGGETFVDGYTDIVDLDVTYDGTISKISNGWSWPARLKTKGSIPATYDGGIKTIILSDESYVRVGLVKQSNANSNNDYFDYGITTTYDTNTNANAFHVVIAGVVQSNYGTYLIGDEFKVAREGNNIRFYRNNGNPFHSIVLGGNGDTFIGKIAMSGPNGSIDSLTLFGNKIEKILQNVDYNYNIRGWLKDINDIETGPLDKDYDLFSLRLNYNNLEGYLSGTSLYNGNISQTLWRSDHTSKDLRSYTYEYDHLNRVTDANSKKGETAGSVIATFHGVNNISYDLNGNILSLERSGYNDNGTLSGLWDDLTYQYDASSNRLSMVTDAPDSSGLHNSGFKDGTNSGVDYGYDANGNMTLDKNKNITAILYNHLNLQTQITVNDNGVGGSIDYVYDATGVKMKKTFVRTGVISKTVVTEYGGNYIYQKVNTGENLLQFFNHPEGYVEPTPVIPSSGEDTKSVMGFDTDTGQITYSAYNYVFQYVDHLGNVRLSYSDLDKNGEVNSSEIVEESNYYPFGLKQKGYNYDVSSNGNSLAQAFKYNGVELNESLGLNLYEMDMRQYDPTIGRFTSIDPITHHSISPYAAFDNNPVFWADPSGATPEQDTIDCPTCDEKGRQTIVDGKYIPRDQRGKSEANNNTENSSNTNNQEQQQNPNHPVKIDLTKDDETVLNSIVEWAIYIRKNNEEKIYLSDIVTLGKTKKRTLFDMIIDAGGANTNSSRKTIRDSEGNTLQVGFDKGYLKPNAFSDNSIIRVDFIEEYRKSNTFHIRFKTYLPNSGLTPTMLYLNFIGEPFYKRIKESIKNPAQPVNLDGKKGGKLNIPFKN